MWDAKFNDSFTFMNAGTVGGVATFDVTFYTEGVYNLSVAYTNALVAIPWTYTGLSVRIKAAPFTAEFLQRLHCCPG